MNLFDFENSENEKLRNKKPEIFKMILRSYARNVSTEVRRKTILNDVNEHEGRNLIPDTVGLLFEDFVIKGLFVYAAWIGGEIRYYRDLNGLECGVVLHLENGDYGLIEIKLGGEKLIEDGISSLKSLENKIIDSQMHEQTFKMIITACGNTYVKDFTYIVPINVLTD